MTDQWYYMRMGKQSGPVSMAELKLLIASGQLRGSDEVWQQGTPDWKSIQSIPAFTPSVLAADKAVSAPLHEHPASAPRPPQESVPVLPASSGAMPDVELRPEFNDPDVPALSASSSGAMADAGQVPSPVLEGQCAKSHEQAAKLRSALLRDLKNQHLRKEYLEVRSPRLRELDGTINQPGRMIPALWGASIGAVAGSIIGCTELGPGLFCCSFVLFGIVGLLVGEILLKDVFDPGHKLFGYIVIALVVAAVGVGVSYFAVVVATTFRERVGLHLDQRGEGAVAGGIVMAISGLVIGAWLRNIEWSRVSAKKKADRARILAAIRAELGPLPTDAPADVREARRRFLGEIGDISSASNDDSIQTLQESQASDPPKRGAPMWASLVAEPGPKTELIRALQFAAGFLLQIFGGLLCVGAFGTGWTLMKTHGPNAPSYGERELCWLGIMIAEGLGMLAFVVGRKLVAPLAYELLRHDRRPPILLLRSFADDEMILLEMPGGVRRFGLPGGDQTLQQTVAKALSRLGPVIAIGRPGQVLPPLGPGCFWISGEDEKWKKCVEELLPTCQRVVMIIGDIKAHPGLTWEVDQLFKLSAPEKIIILVPPLSEEQVKDRWEQLRQRSKGRLPSYEGGELLVTFTHSWWPRVKAEWYSKDRSINAYVSGLTAVIAEKETENRS